MKKQLCLILAAVMATFVTASPQGEPDYHDLHIDAFVPGGVKDADIGKELLPGFNALSKNVKASEAITFAFNCDIPKLQVMYRSSTGKIYTRSRKLKAGQKVIATINKRIRRNGEWLVDATVRWAQDCGNPFPHPFRVTLTIPVWTEKELVIRTVEIVKTDVVTVEKGVVVQQVVPELHDLTINVPEAEHRHRMVIVGNEEAGRRWEYQKDFGDYLLDVLGVIAQPLGSIFQATGSINVASTATGGAGGAGGSVCNTNNNSNSNSSSNANTTVVNTGSGSAAGSSGSSAGSNSKAGGG
ncbi:MAG TPA: hypothetical protein VMQ44_01835 [Candidatus Saccharimonadales bacterium]|nr:hypothetical protein [Candidatus Saccharimonadales bacterium]